MMQKALSRSRLALGLSLLILAGISPGLGAEEANPLIRQTGAGKVEGIEAESALGSEAVRTWAWLGIPYAQPPKGELRWKAPQQPAAWEGVYEAKKFGPICTQYAGMMATMNCGEMGKLMGSEDCLSLNLWRPRTETKGLPVFFWIHGGGNTVGQSSLSLYHGSNLAGAQNLIVVSVNYRLGPFGWFAHPALHIGDKLDDSGNFGTLDILAGLQWVHDNIAAFGGDPGNVTIAGESAGGMNVYSLLVSPLAKGLFHRAISESGAPFSSSLKKGEAEARSVLTKLALKDKLASNEREAEKFIRGKDNKWISDYLRQKSPQEIYGLYRHISFGNIMDSSQIFMDGHVIPGKPSKLLAKGDYNRAPFLVGNNREEAKLFLPMVLSDLTDAKLCGMVREMDPEHPQVMIRDYMGPVDRIVYNPITKIGTAGFRGMGVTGPAKKISRYEGEIFLYQFDWDEEPKPLDFVIGAAHGIELAYVFGNFLSDRDSALRFAWTETNQAGRIDLAKRMMGYWANFARTGNPNGAGLPEWKAWPKIMQLDTTQAVKK